MAKIRWANAGVDRSLTNLNNWIDLATGAAPASLANDDTWIFDRGNEPPDTNNTGRSYTGINLVTTPDFAGYLILGTTSFATVRLNAGGAELSGNVTDAKIAARRGTKVTFRAGTVTALFAECDVSIAGDCVLTTGRLAGPYQSDIALNATAITLLEASAQHRVVVRRNALADVFDSAYAAFYDTGKLQPDSVVGVDGMIDYRSNVALTGQIYVRGRGGLTFANNNDAVAVNEIVRSPNARVDYAARGGLVTPTTETFLGLGATSAGTSMASRSSPV